MVPKERHTPRGDRGSFRVSQEAIHSLTRASAVAFAPIERGEGPVYASDPTTRYVEKGRNRFGGKECSAATGALGEY